MLDILKKKEILKIILLSLSANIFVSLVSIYINLDNLLSKFIISIFEVFLSNGALNAFKIYITENRIVNIKEFFRLTRKNVWVYMITVYAASLAASFALFIFGLIAINFNLGSSIYMGLFIFNMIKYLLLFNGYAAIIGKDSKKLKKNIYNLIILTIVRCIIIVTISLYLIDCLLHIVSILFILLCIYKEDEN